MQSKWTQMPTNRNLSAAPASQLELEAAPGQTQHNIWLRAWSTSEDLAKNKGAWCKETIELET